MFNPLNAIKKQAASANEAIVNAKDKLKPTPKAKLEKAREHFLKVQEAEAAKIAAHKAELEAMIAEHEKYKIEI